MDKTNMVFIATSIDGYIADKNGKIDWLSTIPNPENIDFGYTRFTEQIDALVIGRKTFETVCSFNIPWPYNKPVFVLSNSLEEIPENISDKAFLINGEIKSVLDKIHKIGYYRLYIDGGTTIQNFLREDLIDEIIITTIPVLLGGGSPLFTELPQRLDFECIRSELFLNKIVQNHFRRATE